MAVAGEEWPDTLFWWDDAFHLVVQRRPDGAGSGGSVKRELSSVIGQPLLKWGTRVSQAFKPVRGSARKGVERQDSPLKSPRGHDAFDPDLALWARAIALPFGTEDETEPHPLFPAHGQEGSGDYFSQIEKAVEAAKKAPGDLQWSLFAEGNPSLRSSLESGYLFFPEPMKRYATGIEEWEREKDAPRSAWCFLLAIRGAILLRGSVRRLRWGRRNYPAFPFVFEGSTVECGARQFFRNVELHLPTWSAERARTLAEFEMQVRQFQARLSERGFAATAAEFRAAVVGRGAGAAFDTFHRFVLEGRRPGQRQPMRQGVPRGLTRVGGSGGAGASLRLMLAPLAEKGWFDQFRTDRLRAARAFVEAAIHRAVDEPGLEPYRGVLEALWALNRSILVPGALRREFEDAQRQPRALPLLPAKLWEKALQVGLDTDPAYRLGRAIGSILGHKARTGSAAVGPLLEHMLPVRYGWASESWTVPDPPPSRPLRWTGFDPLGDFRRLLWYRWLDSADLDRLPFAGARYAPLEDIAAFLRGEVDLREVHRLAALFALLDWQSHAQVPESKVLANAAAVPPAYAALRLWLQLGIEPASGARPPRDGDVLRLLNTGQPEQVGRAAARALLRLRVDGLPWHQQPRPMGKAVAHFEPSVSEAEAARLAVALLVPIARQDVMALAGRLWVALEEGKKEFVSEMEVTI
ncbi:MAG TPA: type I-U CRISPR-associated protein Csx17 [Bryobacteraceae bacterium]|nr:type I-U CRISPR-associated protein Csx17 [Bryobacteraceae bacterium]